MFQRWSSATLWQSSGGGDEPGDLLEKLFFLSFFFFLPLEPHKVSADGREEKRAAARRKEAVDVQ